MEPYHFNNQDVHQMAVMLEMNKSLDSLYQKLARLERTGRKGDSEYQQKLRELSKLVSSINDKYHEYQLDASKSVAWYVHLMKTSEFLAGEQFVSTGNPESLMSLNYGHRDIRRLLTHLRENIVFDYETTSKLFSQENSNPNDTQKFYEHVGLFKAMNNDMLSAYLYFIQEHINDKKYKQFKYRLIDAKYNTSFINQNIEETLLTNNFEVSKQLYFYLPLVADIVKIDNTIYQPLKNFYAQEICYSTMKKILQISDSEHNDLTVMTSMLLRQCFLRAAFLLMDEDGLQDLNYTFHSFIESKAYLKNHSQDRISPNIIINSFGTIKHDKNKVHVISLKK